MLYQARAHLCLVLPEQELAALEILVGCFLEVREMDFKLPEAELAVLGSRCQLVTLA